MKKILFGAVLALLFTQLSAKEDLNTVNVYGYVVAEPAKGNELRASANEIFNLLKIGKTDDAGDKIEKLLNAYKAIFDPKLKQYSFLSKEEFDEFNKTSNLPFEWIDWGYAETLNSKSSLEISFQNYNSAYEAIQEMKKVAPYSAFALGEEGFILLKLKRFDEALLSYQKSYDLAMKYKSQKSNAAKALRGKGSTLIDLNQLDEAESAFNKSLEIEPDNRVALSELEYIRSIHRKNKNR